ncbi:MAG: GldG family protein [Proteobacteria bacterium]|nr:GldG family protein [Pseudomonadota bacterium]
MAGLSRKISAGANYFILILIILGFLVLINFLSTRHFSRIDLTENKVYTLSAASKKVASNLDDIVTIRCYFSKKLPPYLINLKQKANDMLDEYKAYAKGNIQINFLDPAENPELENKMRFIGIPQVQMNILEKDQATSTNVYMGIAISYEDKQEVVPFIKDTNNLEYDLTSSILKVTRKEKKTVGFLSSHDGDDILKKYQAVHAALKRQYAVEEVDISEGKPVPAHVDLMIVAGPDRLPERDKYEIDQYIIRGGKVIFLIDIITISGGTIQATYRETNLIDLLEHYGVKVTKNLVLDRINAQITFQTGYTIIRAAYPFYPKIIKEGFDPDHPIVNQLESMIFPWVSALEVLKDTHEDIRFKVLVQSSQYSWLQKGMYNLNPQQQFMPIKEDIKPYPLAVLASGRFKSFYADKEIPPAKKSEGKAAETPETLSESAEENQILVVSNSRFVESNFANQAGNIEFLLNAVDWFTWGKDLIGIRSRRITDRPFPILSERHKKAIKFANILAVPILVAILGFIRFYIKKKKKVKLKNLK